MWSIPSSLESVFDQERDRSTHCRRVLKPQRPFKKGEGLVQSCLRAEKALEILMLCGWQVGVSPEGIGTSGQPRTQGLLSEGKHHVVCTATSNVAGLCFLLFWGHDE